VARRRYRRPKCEDVKPRFVPHQQHECTAGLIEVGWLSSRTYGSDLYPVSPLLAFGGRRRHVVDVAAKQGREWGFALKLERPSPSARRQRDTDAVQPDTMASCAARDCGPTRRGAIPPELGLTYPAWRKPPTLGAIGSSRVVPTATRMQAPRVVLCL
jgi:hypothetical protein